MAKQSKAYLVSTKVARMKLSDRETATSKLGEFAFYKCRKCDAEIGYTLKLPGEKRPKFCFIPKKMVRKGESFECRLLRDILQPAEKESEVEDERADVPVLFQINSMQQDKASEVLSVNIARARRA